MQHGTNLAVMLVFSVMAAVILIAWLFSDRRRRHTRRLTQYLRQHEPAFWEAQPWLVRNLMTARAVESFRRSRDALDPEFAALLATRQRSARRELAALLAGGAVVALFVIGTAYWGWFF